MQEISIPVFLEKAYAQDASYIDYSGVSSSLYTFDMGNLIIRQGEIIACDPFIYDNDRPYAAKFPIGQFPVQLAIARIKEDERVAFSRIKFSDASPVRWELALKDGQEVSVLKEGEIYGYGVDAGTGAFMDTSAAIEYLSFLNEKEDNYEVLTDEMDSVYKPTWSHLLRQTGESNIAIFSSGFGDGFYASYIGFDANGHICRLVTDFAVVE